jgi:aminoglycoside phosphotransferase (APT) family kinase protein
MRSRWRRLHPEIVLERSDITTLLRPGFPGAVVVAAERLSGGLANTNVKIVIDGRATPLLLRLYQRGRREAMKEVALLRRLRRQVPVAELLFFSVDNPLGDYPYAVIDWVEGERLDRLAAAGEDAHALGRAVGETLALIHAITFDRHGFFDPDLSLHTVIDLDRDGLLAYIQHAVATGPGGDRLGRALVSALVDLVERQGHRLSTWCHPCLVHGDFNGSNILLRRVAHREWKVAAVLDWEFALSGVPGFDFAQLLRAPLGLRPRLAESAAQRYRRAGRMLPDDWREISCIVALFAWVDLVSRPDADAAVIDDARRAIQTTITALSPSQAS